MSEGVEGGAAIAWRLLATLEGGSLFITFLALFVYTIRIKLLIEKRKCIRDVLVTNIRNNLGRELKEKLEKHQCNVATLPLYLSQTTGQTPEETRETFIGTSNTTRTRFETINPDAQETVGITNSRTPGTNGRALVTDFGGITNRKAEIKKVDALIIIGADLRNNNLDGMTELMTKDVYENLKLLESESHRVRRGGCIAWACAGATSGAFGSTTSAYDAVLLASLRHIAKLSHCKPIWVGRCVDEKEAAHRIVSALMPCTTRKDSTFSMRNAVQTVSEYACRWFKIIK